eukprot:6291810-Prymnesium_polylepis.1
MALSSVSRNPLEHTRERGSRVSAPVGQHAQWLTELELRPVTPPRVCGRSAVWRWRRGAAAGSRRQ